MLPTPYFNDTYVTLYHADCRLILPFLGGFDLLLTDPPFGIGFAAQPTTGGRKRGQAVESWDDEAPAAWMLVMSWCLEQFPEAKTILDPYAGTGTTGRAAKDRGLHCVLIERDERYCEIAAKRMSQEVLNLGAA